VALDFLLTLALISAVRFAVRFLLVERSLRHIPYRDAREVLIIGAGGGGQAVVSELRRTPGCEACRSASSTTTRASRECGSAA